MPAFEYTALDTAGKDRKGILEGESPRHIRQLLREQQLLPVTVSEVEQKEARRQRTLSFARRVSSGDLALFTRQLATLVRAGLPLEESLAAFERGVMLTRTCQIALKEAEQKVEILLKKAGAPAVEDFSPDDTKTS